MTLKFATERSNSAILINAARHKLGLAYGLGRPLRRVEMARLVGIGGDYMARLAKGTVAISGPVEVVIRMLLAGHPSPWHEDALRSRYHVERGRRPAV